MAGLVLASGSKVRADLLRAAAIDFEIMRPLADEEELKVGLRERGLSPADQALALAEGKCLSVARSRPDVVIGADQILCFQGQAIDKAANVTEARTRLLAMRGHEHQLLSGVVIAKNGEVVWRNQAVSRLWMRDFSEDYLDGYLARCGEQALSSVGCYQLENEGVQLFSKIEGDYFAILGLPLLDVLEALRNLGAIPK